MAQMVRISACSVNLTRTAKCSVKNDIKLLLSLSVEETTGSVKTFLQPANFTLGPDATLITEKT